MVDDCVALSVCDVVLNCSVIVEADDVLCVSCVVLNGSVMVEDCDALSVCDVLC